MTSDPVYVRFAPKTAFENFHTARLRPWPRSSFSQSVPGFEKQISKGPQNDGWPASTRASTDRGEVLLLGPALWQITSCPRGYTRGLHRRNRACRKALFYGAFSKLL